MKNEKNNFYYARKKANLKQREVAEMTGVQNSAVSKWERGATLPDTKTLIKIAKIYNTTTDYLLGLQQPASQFADVRIEQQEILKIYESLPASQRSNLLNYARGLAIGYKMSEINTKTDTSTTA